MASGATIAYVPSMRQFRPLLALLLSMSLLWASAQQALSHAGMAGGITVTLCDQSGQAQTITLDASGRPVTPHDCQDCLAAHALALAARAPSLPQPQPRLLARALPLPLPALPPAHPHPAQPRAPPVTP